MCMCACQKTVCSSTQCPLNFTLFETVPAYSLLYYICYSMNGCCYIHQKEQVCLCVCYVTTDLTSQIKYLNDKQVESFL
jgi:hypothetical protein